MTSKISSKNSSTKRETFIMAENLGAKSSNIFIKIY